MESMYFWRSWEKEHRVPYFLMAAVFLVSAVTMLSMLVLGTGTSISWQSLVQSETIETTLETVTRYPFSIPLKAESFVFLEYFGGSDIDVKSWAYQALFGVFLMGLAYLLTVVTYLPRFWYMVAMGLFIVLLISLKLELLYLFESNSKLGLILAMLLFLPVSYYFQSFNKDARLWIRLVTFAVAMMVMGMVIGLFSPVELPFMQLTVYAFPAFILAAVIFVIIVSHDIIAGFLNAASGGGIAGIGNWKHFFIISTIYLLNVLLIYLKATGIVNWDIIPVSIFVILFLSSVIGVWGYKQREAQYEYLFPFNPLGGLFYISLATLCTAFISFLYITGNDPILDVIHDVAIYAHLGYGFIFIMYIASNFLAPLTRNLPVNKILYTPNIMPYFTYRLAGLLAFGTLLFLENWEIPMEKSFGGYYNSLGDLHVERQDKLLAYGYYLEGSQYAYSNHRSNYALARNATADGDARTAIERYKRSNFSRPTEYSFVNLSNIYFNQDRFFDALFTLKDGLEKFPESGPIMNNIGILYAKVEFYDSAFYYLERAYKSSVSESSARNNILAVMGKSMADPEFDKRPWLIRKGDPVNMTNRYALLTVNHKATEDPFPEFDDSGDQFSHSAVYNYLINNIWRADTSAISPSRKYLGINLFFDRRIELAQALNYYYAGDIGKAIPLMQGVRGGDVFWAGKIDQTLGLWYLDHNYMDLAAYYLGSAKDNYAPEGLLASAVANTFYGKRSEALAEWDSLAKGKDASMITMAVNVMQILAETDVDEVRKWEDQRKYQWILFNNAWGQYDLESGFEDVNYRAKAIMQRMGVFLNSGELESAGNLLSELEGLQITEPVVISEVLDMKMKKAMLGADIGAIASLVDNGYRPHDRETADHIEAVLAASRGDSTQAEQIYNKWIFRDPFRELLAIDMSRFYEAKGDNERAYMVLQNALSLNKSSVLLMREYVSICGRLGYATFGSYILEQLEEILPGPEIERLRSEFTRDLEEWNNSGF